jgi:hypothetical protein
MNYIILLSLLVGCFTRIVDDHYDKKRKVNRLLLVCLAVAYGALIALIAEAVPSVISLALAVLVGLVASGKIDNHGHQTALLSFVAVSLIFGFAALSGFNIAMFLVFVAAGVADEVASSRCAKYKNLGCRILSHRPLLEITALLVSLYTGMWEVWLTLLLYDIGAGYVPVLSYPWKAVLGKDYLEC